jgi:hypothetical protein
MTKSTADTAETSRASFPFSALVFALFGWINVEVFLLTANAGIGAHLMSFAYVTVLSAMAYRRCRVWWPLSGRNSTEPGHSTPVLIGHGLALAAAGCTLAHSMRTGFVTPAVICAAVLCFVPWSKSRFCQRYFFASHALLIAGWIPVLLTQTRQQASIMTLACTCSMWALAAGLILATLSKQRPNDRRSDPGKVEQNACENACDG